jgi:hypothetical protein
VDIPPAAGDLHVGLIDLQAIADLVPAGPGGRSQQRREPHDPAVDSDVVDLDPALGEQLPRRRGRTTRSAGPADGQDDHLGREAESLRRQVVEQEKGESGGFS